MSGPVSSGLFCDELRLHVCVFVDACAVVDRICFAGVSFHDELRCVFVRHAIVTCGVAHCGDVTSAISRVKVFGFLHACARTKLCFHGVCWVSFEQCGAHYSA